MKNLTYISLGILSASIIAFQLSLMQILAIVQWNHFAYMVISVALLGFGASGTLLALAKPWFVKRVEAVVPRLMILTGVSIGMLMLLSPYFLGKFDSYLLFIDLSQLYALLIIYFAFFVPFFLGALAIGLLYIFYVKNIGKLYFADLFGSGTGGLIMMGAFWLVKPSLLPAVISIFPVLAGILILPRTLSFKNIYLPALAFIIPVYLLAYPPQLPSSQYKSISGTMNMPGAEIISERPSPYGFVQVIRAPALRYAPGLSLSYTGEIPVRDVIFNNGNWFGPVVEWSRRDTSHFLDYTTNALPYIVSKPNTVLLLDAGTGLYATHALTRGAMKVTAVENNTVATGILKNDMPDLMDSLYSLPRFEPSGLHSRSFLLPDTSHYDLIILPTAETFGGSSGINALGEQYLLTLEAFGEMWDRLTENGMITITSWMDYPVRNPLKLAATLAETHLRKTDSPLTDHLVAVRSWGTVSFVLKKSPFSREEIANIRAFCDEMYFDPVFIPGITAAERTRYNHLQDSSFFQLADQAISEQRNRLYAEYDFNIQPATDSRPYFSQFLKLTRMSKFREVFGSSAAPFLETGYLIIFITFLQITLAAILFILLPLFTLKWKKEGMLFTILYFSGIGLGFMFVEIILIQQFILYFGNPVYAASAVLSSMLICSGTGSLVSSQLNPRSKIMAIVTAIIISIIVLYVFLLIPILRATIAMSLIPKIAFSIILILPAAFFMGFPFPLGLRVLVERNESLIPWAWGINGCISVISTVLATIIAVEAGYIWVMISAGAAYGLVLGVSLIVR